MLRTLGCASSERDARLGRLLKRTFRFGLLGSTLLLTAGCATIAPRNVLPQADAAQIELEGFHNIRFWGDASAREIQAVMMADASKTEGRLSSGAKGIRRYGITRQVFIAPSIFSFASHDHQSGRPATKSRLFVIRNGKIDPEWQSVSENVVSITQRSISTLIKNQGIGDLYRIYSITKRDGVDFNLTSIPPDFSETSDEPFDQKYMIALFDRGYNLASHNYSWVKAPPGMELVPEQAHY
jgi:hypothetical protein